MDEKSTAAMLGLFWKQQADAKLALKKSQKVLDKALRDVSQARGDFDALKQGTSNTSQSPPKSNSTFRNG